MPYITNASLSLGNQSNIWVTGSGFAKAGFRLTSYTYIDSLDLPSSGIRYPYSVVSNYIRNGLTYENNPASGIAQNLQNGCDLIAYNDTVASFRAQHYTNNLNNTYLLYAFNTAEGSGNAVWCNRPEIYHCEDFGTKVFQKNRKYRLVGRNLYTKGSLQITQGTYTDSINGTITDNTYDPIIYLNPTTDVSGTILYKCVDLGPDGVDQEKHEEDNFAYTNFIIPTGVPDGTYNLYYYRRFNKANIVAYSGITVYSNPLAPSSINFNASSYFTPSRTASASTDIQNLIYIAASSVLATPNTIAKIYFDSKRYLLGNAIVVTSGVYLIGDGTIFDVSPDLNLNVSYTTSIPTRFNGTQTYNSVFNGAIRLTEYCGLDNLHINFGDAKMAPNTCILLRKFLISNDYTFGGDVSITNCELHSTYQGPSTTIYSDGYYSNVKIEDNDIYCYYGILSNKNITGTIGWKSRWSIQRNVFTGNSNRAGGTFIGGIGVDSIIAGNTFKDGLRGIVHSHTNGPCTRNLICNNTFKDGAEYFNSSEQLLFESNSACRYFGTLLDIQPSSAKVPWAGWSQYPQTSGTNFLRNFWILAKEGAGKGQFSTILSNTIDGTIQFENFRIPINSSTVVHIGYGPYNNNICGNRFAEALGGLEYYGNALNNYMSKNEWIRSERGLHIYANTDLDFSSQPQKNNIFWWNYVQDSSFYDSQIFFDTPTVTNCLSATSPSGYELIAYNNFNRLFMVDSSISYNARISDVSNMTNDLHDSPTASSIKPILTYNAFTGLLFETFNWRSSAYKTMTLTPINIPQHSISGLITYGYFSSTQKNTLSINGFTVPLQSGIRYLKGAVGNGVRRWGWA